MTPDDTGPTDSPPSHPSRFADRPVLVTGSTRGIGLGIARRLAAEGADVVVNDEGRTADGNSEPEGPTVAADLREAFGVDARYVAADVSDPAAVERLVDEATDALGGLDVLVNNVGAGRNATVGDLSVEDWEWTMATTLRAGWLCTKRALDALAADGGAVVNVGSLHDRRINPGYVPYNVAKAGVAAMTRAMAVELGPLDVRANCIVPGAIARPNAPPDEDARARMAAVTPAGRYGTPEDVAGAVAFLASDDAAYVTGVRLPVDGGWRLPLNVRAYREYAEGVRGDDGGDGSDPDSS